MNLIKKLFNKKSKTQVFHIDLEKMQNAFIRMQEEAGWDTTKKLFWGYYFLDHNLHKLENFGKLLKEDEFGVVEIRQVDESKFLLHAEHHVSHTPESLFKECHKLAEQASKNEIEVFDGWDVEKIQMNKGLIE